MTTAGSAARFLQALEGSGVPDARGVHHFPRGLVVCVPGDESTVGQLRRALAVQLERNRGRFHLSLVEQNPGAGEALLRFDPAKAPFSLELLSIIESIENTLRRLPGRERGVRLRLDEHQIPDGELPDQGQLDDLCRRYGDGPPKIEYSLLERGRWYQASRVDWRELELPGSEPEAPSAARLRYTDAYLENPGERLALVACPALEHDGTKGFAVRPHQRVPWKPSSGLESARRMDGGLVVDRAPFELLPARRIRAVVVEDAVDPPQRTVLFPFERRRARLTYLGADLRSWGTVLLTPRTLGRLVIATGPGHTRWFANQSQIVVVGADPANEVSVPPRYFFCASNFRLNSVHLQVGAADGAESVEVKCGTAGEPEPNPLAWSLPLHHQLKLNLGTPGEATFELHMQGGSRRSAALKLSVKHRRSMESVARKLRYEMGSRFELGGHRFTIEEEVV